MKKILTAAALAILVQACNTTSEKAPDEKRIVDSLQAINEGNNSVINSFLVMFNDVESELDSIAGKQKNIYIHTSKPADVKSFSDVINTDIRAINEMISSSRKRIGEINSKLKAGNRKNSNLEKAIADLNKKLSEREDELTQLKAKLDEYSDQIEGLNSTIGMLGMENDALQGIVNEEARMLHTAYFVAGTSKELQKDSVIDRKGGLLGIGMTSKMKNNYNPKAFTIIDNMQTKLIPVNSKNITIVTSHPSDAYTFDKEGSVIKNIVITDPEKFWKASKYLVVIKNQ
jgi:chromosome segregation ATPase